MGTDPVRGDPLPVDRRRLEAGVQSEHGHRKIDGLGLVDGDPHPVDVDASDPRPGDREGPHRLEFRAPAVRE